MCLQLSPLQKNRNTVDRYTGVLTFKSMILLRIEGYNSYPYEHWVLVLKKYEKSHASHLCELINNSL